MLLLHVAILGLLTLVAALPATSGATSSNCTSGNFVHPFILRDIFMWQEAPASNRTTKNSTSPNVKGHISFTFIDPNKDLHLLTECNSKLTNGVTPNPNGGYNFCKNENVGFQFTEGGDMLIERAYIDPCLGPYPYNGGVVFGQSKASMLTSRIEGFGVVGTRVRLEVPITSQA